MKGIILIICILLLSTLSFSQKGSDRKKLGDIAREVKNPVSLLYRIPIHNDFEVGDMDNQLRYTLKAEPSAPFVLNNEWKIIVRGMLSFIRNQYNGMEGSGPSGLNDLDLSGFLAPVNSKPFVWGAGIALDLPTATDPLLGDGKWTAGPSCLIVKEAKGWTFGLLARQVWSYAGDPDRKNVNYAYINPWIDYTFENGFGLKLESEAHYDWKGGGNTVPLRFGINRVFKMGKKWFGNIDLDGLYYAARPDNGPRWGVSVTITMLLQRTTYVNSRSTE